MGVGFRIGKHSVLDTEVVEILIDGMVGGIIYQMGENGIKLVSAHMANEQVDQEFAGEVVVDDGSTTWPPISAIRVEFEPSPYHIEGGRIVKHS